MTTDTEKIVKIIQAVRKHECLWNAHSPQYAKRDKLEKAWLAVSEEVGNSDVFCREKWRNVRTGFLRSIQNNFRIVANQSTNDLQAVRRKRFYLYDQMKFLLPSAELLNQARKRRKSKLVSGEGDTNDEYNDATVQDYTLALIGKYELNGENENIVEKDLEQHHEERTEEEETGTRYQQILKELDTDDDAGENSTTENNKISTTDNTHSEIDDQDSLVTKKIQEILEKREKSETCLPDHQQDHERAAHQMLDFFKGNIDDVLSLSKRNQRLFKRKMLEIIEELHDMEEAADSLL